MENVMNTVGDVIKRIKNNQSTIEETLEVFLEIKGEAIQPDTDYTSDWKPKYISQEAVQKFAERREELGYKLSTLYDYMEDYINLLETLKVDTK